MLTENEKKETPDVFDREAGLRSTSCYSSPVFTSLDVVLFFYLSVSSIRRSVFLIVSRRVCAGFGRRLQTVVLFVCLLSGAETYPPHSPTSCSHPHPASAASVMPHYPKILWNQLNAARQGLTQIKSAAYVISAVSLNPPSSVCRSLPRSFRQPCVWWLCQRSRTAETWTF